MSLLHHDKKHEESKKHESPEHEIPEVKELKSQIVNLTEAVRVETGYKDTALIILSQIAEQLGVAHAGLDMLAVRTNIQGAIEKLKPMPELRINRS